MKKLVEDDFDVPLVIEFPRFLFRPLDVAATELDYEAVMSSRHDLRGVFLPGDDWPEDDMTLQQNTEDLRQHWKLFEERTSFAWTVLTPDSSKCVGCVYLYWPLLPDFDATVYLWARSDAPGLDAELESTVKGWLAAEWPFENPAFPGRDIPWDRWEGGRADLWDGIA